MTFLYVTHDQEEALTMSDRIAVFNEGRIEQVGTPAEVFEHPANDFVMRFLGHVNVLDATLVSGDVITGGPQRGQVYVRPHEIDVARTQTPGSVPARVLRVTPLNAGLKVELHAKQFGKNLRADIDWQRGSALALRDGDDVYVSLRRARVFNDEKAAA
jgi:sulfate transport system ATP-binding protein